MDALSVRVLGELSIDGIDVRSSVDRKARLLLRYLALARGRPVPTESLADALWGDKPPAKPADQVAVLASRLRRALGSSAVEHGDHGYRLDYAWLDLDELSRLVAATEERRDGGNVAAASAAARVAVSLLRGPLPRPDTDAAWAQADHAAAVRLVMRARRSAADALLASGDWLDALDLAAAAVQEDPYDEDAVRLVMRANAAGGRPAAALATYAALRELVADELGTDPAPETAALNEAILRGELVTAVASATPAHLVGRSSQLGHLDSLADRRSVGARVAVVTGEGGIGKTSLVRAWSEARAARGDTVLFGTCGTLDSSTPLDVLLAAIGEHLRRSDDPAGLLAEDAALLGPLLGVRTGDDGIGAVVPDGILSLASLYAAITGVLSRIGGDTGVIVVLDDAHLAGPTLADWARFAERRPVRLLIVAAARPAEGSPFPAAEVVNLGPLDRAAVTELVGSDRAADLHERSGGHPLFLHELATAPEGELPASLVASIERRCDDLGSGSEVIRSAAVLGTDLDVDLLASVLGRAPLDVLADLETAADRNLLVEKAGRFAFRHALVRQALTDGTRGSRAALLHRQASVVLAGRPDADPVEVAEHARLGGDTALAARSLREAAARAADRFDHVTAENLLDQSQRLAADDATLIARARIRIRLGKYAEAEADATAAPTSGAEGDELRAWAAYFDRRFEDAVQYAHDGELTAEDPSTRARCQIVGARTLHARGQLDEAQRLLGEAVESSVGVDRLTASAWLGALYAHRSRVDDALALMRPATRPGLHVDHTSASMHAWLFTGQAHAAAGRSADALAAFRRYTEEVEKRQVPRFGGRGTNSAGWVLRNIGATDEARDIHLEALEYGTSLGTPEVRVAALEDLADDRLLVGDPEAATGFLDEAESALTDTLVFGWRLELKLALLRTRVSMLAGDPEAALAGAAALQASADAIGVPRYSSVARLLHHHARAALGEPVDREQVQRDLSAAQESIAIEAWWWAGETAVAVGEPAFLTTAEELADRLAARSARPEEVRAAADHRLEGWRLRLPRSAR
ncbi:MAG: ATP-binding protein [Marmoricola sp.]